MVTIDARAGKWLALALLVSLGANMFMGGLLAGRFAGPAPEPPEIGTGPGGGGPAPGERPLVAAIRRMAEALPEADRTRFEQAFLDRRRDIARAQLALRDARLELRDAIMADPFDRAKVEQAFAALRTRNDEVQRTLHTIALDAIARLSKDSRQALANWAQPPRAPQGRPGERLRGPAPGGPTAPGGAPGSNRP
jgi:uncharacterized membrane protein